MNEILHSAIKRVSMIRLNTITGVIIPNRNTHILKRRYAPRLAKENASNHKVLKAKHFIYDLVEDTNTKEPPDLHVLLTTFVEGIGDIGDVISLMPHYARQHLLLPHKAVYATPENIEYYSELKKSRPERPEFSSIYAGMTIRFLSKKVVPVFMNSEEAWTLEPWHVQVAFRIEGVIVPIDAIQLPDSPVVGPDPTKEDKDFAVYVTINNTEKVPVRCRLFHIKKEIGIIKLSEEFYLERREPILKEQEELLANLPTPEIEDNSPENNISLKEKYRITLIQ